MDNGATAALNWYTPHFHGNQNFFNLFSGWFGSPLIPSAFRTPGNGSVYMHASGYKFYVPTNKDAARLWDKSWFSSDNFTSRCKMPYPYHRHRVLDSAII